MKWISLKERRDRAKAIMMFRELYGLVPAKNLSSQLAHSKLT